MHLVSSMVRVVIETVGRTLVRGARLKAEQGIEGVRPWAKVRLGKHAVCFDFYMSDHHYRNLT